MIEFSAIVSKFEYMQRLVRRLCIKKQKYDVLLYEQNVKIAAKVSFTPGQNI